jgi:hypothetical protein
MTTAVQAPSWLPDVRITLAQLASGILEYAEGFTGGTPFRLPYPANLQLALDRLTLLAWHQSVPPPGSVVELLQLAHTPFAEWSLVLTDADVDPEESLLAYGRPTVTCEELGKLRGDVEAELRENALMHGVLDKSQAHDAPGARLRKAAGEERASCSGEVIAMLSTSPADAAPLALLTMKDLNRAWDLG